jgi:hypothetical protein
MVAPGGLMGANRNKTTHAGTSCVRNAWPWLITVFRLIQLDDNDADEDVKGLGRSVMAAARGTLAFCDAISTLSLLADHISLRNDNRHLTC